MAMFLILGLGIIFGARIYMQSNALFKLIWLYQLGDGRTATGMRLMT
jgi:hypothetical protein